MLPPDASRGYLKRYQDALKNTVTAAGFGEKFNILKFSLVSAKNGYGIEDLITVGGEYCSQIIITLFAYFRIFIQNGWVRAERCVAIFTWWDVQTLENR